MRRTIAIALFAAACRPAPTTAPTTSTPAPSPGALVDAADAPAPEADAPSPAPKIVPRAPDDETPLAPLPTLDAAEVGKVAIPMRDFHEIYDLKVAKYAKHGRALPVTADARYRKSIAERLVYHEVLRQEAAELGVVADPVRVTDREASQRNGIVDWPRHIELRGETDHSLREMIVAELREEAILTKLGKLEITRAEVETEYAAVQDQWRSDSPRVRASHILFPIGGSTSFVMPGDPPQPARMGDTEAEAKAKAFEVYALAKKKGADFAALAREHSTGPSAQNGGDIGIFTRDRMAEEFSDAAFALKVGQVSKPVKTKFGWHIIKVTGRWPAGVLPMAALEDQIIARLRQRKLYTSRRELKAALLAKYTIVDHIAPTL